MPTDPLYTALKTALGPIPALAQGISLTTSRNACEQVRDALISVLGASIDDRHKTLHFGLDATPDVAQAVETALLRILPSTLIRILPSTLIRVHGQVEVPNLSTIADAFCGVTRPPTTRVMTRIALDARLRTRKPEPPKVLFLPDQHAPVKHSSRLSTIADALDDS